MRIVARIIKGPYRHGEKRLSKAVAKVLMAGKPLMLSKREVFICADHDPTLLRPVILPIAEPVIVQPVQVYYV